MMIGALAILILAYGNGLRWPDSVTAVQWGWFLWLAIPASTGSFGLWFVALSKGGAARASGFLFLAPLFTVVLAYFAYLGFFGFMDTGCWRTLDLPALWLINRD